MPKSKIVRRSVAKPTDAVPAPKPVAAPKLARASSKLSGVVSSIVHSVQKKVRGSAINTLDQRAALSDVKEWIPSGFPGLDAILGGGWAVGRASEVFGDEGCGKTALAHRAILGVQSIGGVAVLLDFEAALDEQKITQLGIDPTRLIYEIPDHIEQGWDIIWSIMDTLQETKPDAPFLIVWDSIGGAVPKAELDAKSSEKATVGEVARAMSRGCRRMFKTIASVRAHMMWISQERHKIGGFSPLGPVKETSGGKGPKYAASQRLRCARVKTLSSGERKVGYLIKSITKKNRLAAPEQTTEWVIDFRFGPSPEMTMLNELQEAGRVVASKGSLMFRPWGSDFRFKRADWVEILHDKGRMETALQAYMELVQAGGAFAMKRAQDAEDVVGSSDTESEE